MNVIVGQVKQGFRGVCLPCRA